MVVERKCTECGMTISVEKDRYDGVIYFRKEYYHEDCFISSCKRKSSKTNSLPIWKAALEQLDTIRKDTYPHLDRWFRKDEVFSYVCEAYDVKTMPKYFFVKLQDVYDGALKGMSEGIPANIVLDMWQRKQDYLDKNYARLVSQGKKMTVEQRVSYDLSILVSNYDKYCKWKERQKILEATQSAKDSKSDTSKPMELQKLGRKKTESKQDDMDSLLDELFD